MTAEELAAMDAKDSAALDAAIDGTVEQPPESLDAPGASDLRIGTPKDHARLVVEHAHTLALLTGDPSRRDAFEAIKCAVLAMLGDRERLPVDALTRLRAIVLRGSAPPDNAAGMRTLVELVERRACWVREYGEAGVRNEAAGLRRDVQSALGRPFAGLTNAHCAAALRALLLKHGSGKRTTRGAAADLAIAVRAWGCKATRRNNVLREIDKAIKRGMMNV
jgi:hypothetical protein